MATPASAPLTNYVAFLDALGNERIGHLDLEGESIQPLAHPSGTPLSTLLEVITAADTAFQPTGEVVQLDSVKLLPPLRGRDVLAIGKNYFDHAIEFHASGYDSSDKVDQPSHPVVFTKRATSIIAHGEEIYAHPSFTQSLDYEGEVGAIIGKAGFGVKAEDAGEYIWGYTIINDVTAREKQRDHKQFFIGKSGDTFCPMGPIAVPASSLPEYLRVQTHVNGEKRQDATTEQLIFSVPTLIETISQGQTIQLGDVIATGTPVGVGFGQKPPVWLHPGDVVDVTVTGLGTLSNRIGTSNPTPSRIASAATTTSSPIFNAAKTAGRTSLTQLPNKQLYSTILGTTGPAIVFIHGLGGTHEFYLPLIRALRLADTHRCLLFDLEGHGLSPTRAASPVSIASYAADVLALLDHHRLPAATLVAHSMGCYVAARLAATHPARVAALLLLGPAPPDLPAPGRKGAHARASTVRKGGMLAVADGIVAGATSTKTRETRPASVSLARLSLLSQDPEGYAKGCNALATAPAVELGEIACEVLVVTGDEDGVSPPAVARGWAEGVKGEGRCVVLEGVGHWHVYEDVEGVSQAVRGWNGWEAGAVEG